MSARRIVRVDEDYDRSHASVGQSRFGAYLRQRANQFDDDGAPLDAVWFAMLVWQIANGPVMSPPYVQTSSRVYEVACRGDEYAANVLVATVRVRLPHPPQAWDERAAGCHDWTHDRGVWRTDDEPLPLVAPEQFPQMLFTVNLSISIPTTALPAPTSTDVEVDVAKDTVRTICTRVNENVGPQLESLLSRWQDRRR